MQFLTIREPHAGEYYIRRSIGGRNRGWFDHFGYSLTPDATEEGVAVCFSTGHPQNCAQFLWPAMEAGVRQSVRELLARDMRLCSVNISFPFARHHGSESTPEIVQSRVNECVLEYMLPLLKPIEPLHADWLTSDVIALAKGIHADAATDRCPILSDALRDAGCVDALIHEHLQLCPDHGTSCWVVEMILFQTRA